MEEGAGFFQGPSAGPVSSVTKPPGELGIDFRAELQYTTHAQSIKRFEAAQASAAGIEVLQSLICVRSREPGEADFRPSGRGRARGMLGQYRSGDAHNSVHSWMAAVLLRQRTQRPPHIHARKGDVECKYWLHAETYDIEEDYAYNLSPADRRVIRKIIFEHFEYIMAEYEKFHIGTD